MLLPKLSQMLRLPFSNVPSQVCLKIVSQCNLRCVYCNVRYEKRPIEHLPYDLFINILDSLKKNKFKGIFQFCGFCESLTDPRVFGMIKDVRRELPNSIIWVLSNGKLVTVDVMEKLNEAGANLLIITRHETEWREKVEYDYSKTLHITDQVLPSLLDRLGIIKLPNLNYIPIKNCYMQYVCMISANGKVALCCNDFNSKHGMGIDLNKTPDLCKEWGKFNRCIERLKIALGFKKGVCKTCARADLPKDYFK